ncbi:hypothetical protein CPC08DRAFT_649626, partial [Agrocybe pediades]
MVTVPANNGWTSYQYKSAPTFGIQVEDNSLPPSRNPGKRSPGPPSEPDYPGGPAGGWPRRPGEPGRPSGPPFPGDPKGSGGGPPSPGNPRGGGGAGNPNPDEDWQMNPKINLANLPQWNGKSDSLISYLSEMSGFAKLGQKMRKGIGQLATVKWAGPARQWWDTLPSPEQLYLSQSWDHLLRGIREHFMNENWVRERTREFEEMKFRQKGHEYETPLEFIQRRIRHHQFLFTEDTDGPSAIVRILRTQPTEWTHTLNEYSCPTMFQLQNVASRMQQSLESHFLLNERLRNPTPKTYSFHKRRNAMTAKIENEDESDEEIITGSSEEEAPKEAKAAFRGKVKSKGPIRPRSSKFPEGKTIDGYSFTRDDSVVSSKLPNGTCFICTSPKHFFRDCPHYGRFEVLRNANMLHVDWAPEQEAEWDREYLAMIVESNASPSSAYSPHDEVSVETKEVHTISHEETEIPKILPRKIARQLKRSKGPVKRPTEDLRATQDLEAEGCDKNRAQRFKDSVGLSTPTVVIVPKNRALPEGMGSLGSRALHIKACIARMDENPIVARLDSGADITLMSEEYYSSLKNMPNIKEGLRMKLYHLTGNAKVLGYIRTQLFAESDNGTWLQFELEAYIVRDMKVPILLGEDFQ